MKRLARYRPKVEIYVDGGCRPNPGFGAAASILVMEGRVSHKRTQFKADTNNAEMELLAFIQGLVNLKVYSDEVGQKFRASVYSDSTYVVNGSNEWLPRWSQQDYKGNKGNDIKNPSLWKFADELLKTLRNEGNRITIYHIRGHSGNVYNEMVDNMCTQVILGNR